MGNEGLVDDYHAFSNMTKQLRSDDDITFVVDDILTYSLISIYQERKNSVVNKNLT